jgi:predicted enzyme related to lactoylglutathione lyase
MSRLAYTIAFTKHFEAMRKFYQEGVGLRVRVDEPQWVEFETRGAIWALHEMPDDKKQGMVLRFVTDDLDAECRGLRERGVKLEAEWRFSKGRLVDVWDPDGNLLSNFQPNRPLPPSGQGPPIERVILNVSDMGGALAFYRASMGFRPESEATHWVEFDTGDTKLAVHHRVVGDDHPRHAEQPIAVVFGAGDVTAWCDEMRGRGIHFATAPITEEFGVYAEATDPDGRIVVFHEPPPPASLEEELAEAYEDDASPRRVAMRKPLKKVSATVSMLVQKPHYRSDETPRTPRRRRPSATTRAVSSVRGAGPDHARLKPKRTADEKKARVKPAIGRLKKAEARTLESQRTEVARSSKSRPLKRASANAGRRRTGR